MYETTSTFLQSELSYRTDRLKSGLARNRSNRRFRPRGRRHADAINHAR